MINPNINAQIDQLTGGASAIDESLPLATLSDESVFTGETEEVAGLGKIIFEKAPAVVKKVITREVKEIKKGAPVKTPSQQVKELAVGAERQGLATETEAKKAGKVQQKMNEEPQISVEDLQKTVDEVKPQLAAAAPEDLTPKQVEFNLPLISESNDLQSIVNAVTKDANIKTENITFDDVIASAKAAGMDDTFVNKLTDGTLTVNAKNTYLALEAQRSSAVHLEKLLRTFKDAPDKKILDKLELDVQNNVDGAQELLDAAIAKKISPAVEMEAMQTIAFHSLLQRSVKNYQTNVAQSLAVMRIPRSGVVSLDDATDGLMSSSDLMKFANAFLKETDAAKRAKLIDSTAKTGWKDKTFSVFVNNILSRPSTHVKNALSNFLMIPLRGAEKTVAAGIGATRQIVGLGSEDRYFFAETYSSLSATVQAVKDGLEMGKFAAKEGYSSTMDDASKIDLAKARTEIFDYASDSPLAGFWKTANFVATLPGRSLLTADEFYKGVAYRYELERTATREGIKAYDNALATGVDAEKAFDDAAQNIYDNPPDEILGLSQEATSTKKLEGMAKKMQDVINDDSFLGFLARTQVPFITTPVNLNLQVLERTPLGFVTKKVREDLAKGGKDADLAMAKIGMGTGAGFLFTNYAAEGKITGSGPSDKGQRAILTNQGWQPYSIVLDFSGLSEEQRNLYAELPVDIRYGTGDYKGKAFISYQGLEPIGAFLAMASNSVEYAKYEKNTDKVNAQMAGVAYGFYDYMMSSPFLQGLSNISSAIGIGPRSNQEQTLKLFDELGKSLVTFAGKTVVPLSGLMSSVREKTDPYQREYKIDKNADSILPMGVREGINSVLNSTPGLSDNLPPKLDIWGQPVLYESPWSPIKMKSGKDDKANEIIIQTGTQVSYPSRIASMPMEKGLSVSTELSPLEYNLLLEIANDPAGIDLQGQLVNTDISSLPLYRQQVTIKAIMSSAFEKAKKQLIGNSIYSDDIQKRIQDKYLEVQDAGLGAK